ncbi:MAG: PACE efflux transporter [Pikeienuella sp.]
MTLRSPAERLLQTGLYELGGLLLAAPLYATVTGSGASQSLILAATLSAIAVVWMPLHNALFDLVEYRRTRRTASDRPHGMRLLHAVSLETTTTLATLPAIMVVGGHGFWEALAIDLGLTLLFAGYAYGFHLVYDRLRPIPGAQAAQALPAAVAAVSADPGRYGGALAIEGQGA